MDGRDMSVLLEVSGLCVDHPVRPSAWRPARVLQAVRAVSFQLEEGETLGIVGESGCGKSTLARALTGLVTASAGEIRWRGRSLQALPAAERQSVRREMQMVFQDPAGSLDPRMEVHAIVAEPLEVFEPSLRAPARAARVRAMLERVGLGATHLRRFPHELSGGQCQRVAIARALVLEPKLLICDEPVSALDVSVQAQIVNLLRELQRDLGLSMIFISHNMAVVRQVSARVLVMYLGRVMEVGSRDDLFASPRHPYTRTLLAAVPIPDPRAARAAPVAVPGEAPSPLDPPPGCVFHPRCSWMIERCRQAVPAAELAGERMVACLRWREISGG
jgi:oligopeptide transport system ATP-binding protein